MTIKTKPNQKIHVDKLQTTLEKLGQLKEKPKSELNLRESIYFLRDKLKSALKKGYSYQDLSEILAEQDILISATTLKQYLAEINKQSAARKKRIKSKQNQKSISIKSDDKSLNKVDTDKAQEIDSASLLDDQSAAEASNNNIQPESDKIPLKTKGASKFIKTKSKDYSDSSDDIPPEFNQF